MLVQFIDRRWAEAVCFLDHGCLPYLFPSLFPRGSARDRQKTCGSSHMKSRGKPPRNYWDGIKTGCPSKLSARSQSVIEQAHSRSRSRQAGPELPTQRRVTRIGCQMVGQPPHFRGFPRTVSVVEMISDWAVLCPHRTGTRLKPRGIGGAFLSAGGIGDRYKWGW